MEPFFRHLLRSFKKGQRRRLSDTHHPREDRRNQSKSLSIWQYRDLRLEMSLFSSNVPTLILNQEQRILDWNLAFDLAFQERPEITRGRHVNTWYKCLDNFRSIPKRVDKLYGEGILPICDRERVTFISQTYGRMVFTKIMSPVMDRVSGKVIGWTVVLNINSVTKRQEFFDALLQSIQEQGQKVRYLSSLENIYRDFTPYKLLVERVISETSEKGRVLVLGTAHTYLVRRLLENGRRVYVASGDSENLRQLRIQLGHFGNSLKLVKRGISTLESLPAEKFDYVVGFLCSENFEQAKLALAAENTIKPNGRWIQVDWLPSADIAQFHDALRLSLQESEEVDKLKHQLNHVTDYEKKEFFTLGQLIMARHDFFAHSAMPEHFFIAATEEVLGGHAVLRVVQKVALETQKAV